MAKKKGVPGWHSMRKEQLIRALLKLAKDKATMKNGSTGKSPSRRKSTGTTKPSPESKIAKKLRAERAKNENLKDLALVDSVKKRGEQPEKDRVVLIVRDPYWLQACKPIGR